MKTNFKKLYDWIEEIKSIAKDSLISIKIADVSYPAIEIMVDFVDIKGERFYCMRVVGIENENRLDYELPNALDKMVIFVKSHFRLEHKESDIELLKV